MKSELGRSITRAGACGGRAPVSAASVVGFGRAAPLREPGRPSASCATTGCAASEAAPAAAPFKNRRLPNANPFDFPTLPPSGYVEYTLAAAAARSIGQKRLETH